ncbi:MAG: DNA adenine methylase [Candidatus Methanomethylophilaceae archaeon]|nr:DNA adenine methylase [Candidatus Methanomethylophilaceae archaeon]
MIPGNRWTVEQASVVWGISPEKVSGYCRRGSIPGAEYADGSWLIPAGAEKPRDAASGQAKPFLKWAGGKGQLLDSIRRAYPPGLGKDITKYAEPFVGGGAVLFDILNTYEGIEKAYISDVNSELICTYTAVRDRAEELISLLGDYQERHLSLDADGRKKYYAGNRIRYNRQMLSPDPDPLEVASLFIYLNKTCFNGLYRVNSGGLFNVPAGRYKNPVICDADNIRRVSEKLQKVTIENKRYDESRDFIDGNTFVYFDPPYRPLTDSSNFTSYTEYSFDDDDQRALAGYVRELSDAGAKVSVSNSDPRNTDPGDSFFDDLYSFAHVRRVAANRMINSKPGRRGKISEILVTNYEIPEKW